MSIFSRHPFGDSGVPPADLERLGLSPDFIITDPNGTTVAVDEAASRAAVGSAGYLSVIELDAIADVIVKPRQGATELCLVLDDAHGGPVSLYFREEDQARLAQLQMAIALVRSNRYPRRGE